MSPDTPTSDMADDGVTYSAWPDEHVATPIMTQDWTHLTFLHWSYEPHVIQRLLPSGLQVEVFGDQAWVGLVPFYMRIHLAGVLAVPYATICPETNVRTYIRGPDGRSGIHFFSLDLPRLPAVAGARIMYGLPYMWSKMSVDRGQTRVTYRCRRLWSSWPLATSNVTTEIGEPILLEEQTELERFLTARWRLYTKIGGVWFKAAVEHQPWPLWRARAVEVMDSLVMAAGIPAPAGEPLAHYSPGVHARISLPLLVKPGSDRGPS